MAKRKSKTTAPAAPTEAETPPGEESLAGPAVRPVAAPTEATAATVSEADRLRYVCANVEMVDLATLNHDPANARLHPEVNIEAIKASLTRFGQDQPLVVQRAGRIVRKGNGRMASMNALGWTKAAVVWVEDDNWEAVARALADNRTSELATWDVPVLGEMMRGLESAGKDKGLGWTAEEVKAIMAAGVGAAGTGEPTEGPGENGFEYAPTYAVIVKAKDEADQKEIYERLVEMKLDCKVVCT